MMKKRIVSLLLVLVLAFTLVPAAFADSSDCGISYCTCSGYCSFGYTDYQYESSTMHSCIAYCTGCGKTSGVRQLGSHNFVNGVCTECGYSDGTGGGGGGDWEPDICYHWSTYRSWSGCRWYEYCYSCGALVDSDRETEIEGIFACGNVLHVHDLVDFVTLESQTAGEGAARYIKNGGNKEKKYVKTRGINGVRYIVPQKIALGEDEDVKLFFRVGDVHKNAKVVVTYNGETLISKKRPRLAPGEMENVIIKSDMLKNFDENGIIEIQVEE